MKSILKIRVFRDHSRWILLIPVFASVIFCSSCKDHSATLSKAEMKAIVERQNEMLGSCFTEGDAEKLAEMYTDSAKLSPNGSSFITGRDSIKDFWLDDFKSSKVLKMNTHVLTIDGNKDLIYETGKAYSQILYNDSIYNAKVKYINVWRRQPDGNYKLDVDFWNKDGK